jgi:hypothetical protein
MDFGPFLSFVRRVSPVFVAIIALGFNSVFAAGEKEKEQKLQARLIWGTDASSNDPKIKPVDAQLKEKFSHMFKWKNYFEVDRQHFSIAPDEHKKVKMSPKCDIEVHNEGQGMFEIRLIGEGKLRDRVRQTVKAGKLLVIGGDDKNSNAWFVVVNLE